MMNDEVVLGDCVKGMEEMPPSCVDLIITDPPYDVDYGNKSKVLSESGNDRKKQILRDKNFVDKFDDYETVSRLLFKVLKDDSHLYLFCAEKQIGLWIDNLTKAGFKFNNIMVWVKNRQTLDMTFGLKYSYKTEILLFFRKGVRKLNKLGLSNVLDFKTGNDLKHGCEKPVDLLRFLISNSSYEDDVVFDPFAGGGSTMVAAKQLNRHFFGFEISDYYHNVIIDRLKQKTLNETLEVYTMNEEQKEQEVDEHKSGVAQRLNTFIREKGRVSLRDVYENFNDRSRDSLRGLLNIGVKKGVYYRPEKGVYDLSKSDVSGVVEKELVVE